MSALHNYTPSPKTKPYETRHRLTWAARHPLKPGADLRTRQAILLQIADTAISGQYYEPQAKLAERVGMSVRGVQKALEKLCSEGALRAHRRGFKKTTRYTLMRLAEVAEHGDFLPSGEVSDSTFETNPSSPQTPNPPPFETNPSSPRIAFETNPSSYNAVIRHAVNPLNPPLRESAPEPGTISPTARRLHDYIVKGAGRPLPEAWLFYPTLKQEVERLNFPRLASELVRLLNRPSSHLSDPQEFFENYDEQQAVSNRKNRKRRAA